MCGLAPAGSSAAAAASPASTRVPTAKAQASTRTKTGAGSSRTGSGKTPSTRSGRSARSTRSGSTRSGRSATTRAIAGGRPLARPALPLLDPLAALVPPVVPDRKRFCSSCDAQLKRESGFCPKCGQVYSFVPSLKEGDMVAEKYEIKGTIAFGGLGWIYLALDTVLTRWVTLKGLLNAKDPRMLEVAVHEREFLASIKHPNVVGIYDFVTHGEQGFIVMEHVNGKTLMEIRKEKGGPLPVAEAISYILEILPAFDYLDQLGLVYCDFKPENVMVEEDTVKLIDMGAVRRVDDLAGDIYGSRGYTAPEAHDAPTPISDLYSIGRALAVMVASFDFQGKYATDLPPPEEHEVFRDHEPLYRFLKKATRPKAEERFASASDMAEQLVGVLRSVAGATVDLGPSDSAYFANDSDRDLSSSSAQKKRGDGIPRLKVDPADAAASVIIAAGAVSDPERRLAMFQRALTRFPDSIELELRIIDELVTLARFDEAEEKMKKASEAAPNDWRVAWYRGRALLNQGKLKETLEAFQALSEELPGELDTAQALGVAFEAAGQVDRAMRYYDSVSRADSSFASAALRLARCLEEKGDQAGAIAAYRRVPTTSNRHPRAQLAIAKLLIHPPNGGSPSLDDVLQAGEAAEALDGVLEGLETRELRAEVFVAGALAVPSSNAPATASTLLNVEIAEAPLRTAAEAEYRSCARQASTDDDRIRYVDLANEVRPLTWT